MYPTKYHKLASIAQAVAALACYSDAMVLAGGQTLSGTMKQNLAAPSDLVDIRAIDGLVGVSVARDTLSIGAVTTHAEVVANADFQRLCPALAKLANGIGGPVVHHMGTIGGSIANNDPAADYPAGLLALGATIVTKRMKLQLMRSLRACLQPRWSQVRSSLRLKSWRLPKRRMPNFHNWPRVMPWLVFCR